MSKMRTFRLVADRAEDFDAGREYLNGKMPKPVCIDIVLRSESEEGIETISKRVREWLDYAGGFMGSWVGSGTYREGEYKVAVVGGK